MNKSIKYEFSIGRRMALKIWMARKLKKSAGLNDYYASHPETIWRVARVVIYREKFGLSLDRTGSKIGRSAERARQMYAVACRQIPYALRSIA